MSVPARVRLLLVAAPLRWPHAAAHGIEAERTVVLVEWTGADGSIGWGECPTLSSSGYVTETTAAAWEALRDRLVPDAVAGRRLDPTVAPAAAAALVDARLDSMLRARRRSLRSHLGGTRPSVRWTAVIAALGATPDTVAARARDAVEQGASMVKVKVRPGVDVELVEAVSAAIGARPVAADANGSYASPEELSALDSLGLAYIEQPVGHGRSWAELAEVRATLSTPVALDESVCAAADLERAIGAGAADLISVKPARVGGAQAAASLARQAAAAGLGVFVGGMLELGVGRATALAVASLDACGWPADLGPSDRYVTEEVTDALALDPDGRVLVPDGPGIGVRPDPGRLSSMTVDELVVGHL